MKKTLGGDRLGSGKKMTVDLHNYERSTHDLGFVFRSTMAPGTLVPFMADLALPGDTWEIDLDCNVLTLPTIGPLFGSFKVQLDLFETPIRLYHAWLHNNKLNIGRNMKAVKLPLMTLTAYQTNGATDLDNSQINPSCILSYLGIRGVGFIAADEIATATRSFHALKLLGYWDIYKNYYANKQEEIGAVIHTGAVAPTETIDDFTADGNTLPEAPTEASVFMGQDAPWIIDYTGAPPIPAEIMVTIIGPNSGTYSLASLSYPDITDSGTQLSGFFYAGIWGESIWKNWRYITANEAPSGPPRVQTFPLANIDTAREEILERATSTAAVIINDFNLTPYDYVIKPENGRNNMLNTQEGLAVKTYQSDIFNNWLDTEWIDGAGGITELTRVSTAGGFFTIDNLNLSQKLYDIYNRIAVSGGSYDDWMDAVYATERYTRCETPIYHGGLSKELVFQEVVSNAQSSGENGSQPLGTLAGRGVLARKHKGGRSVIRVQEPSYIWGIVSLTPRIDYSQGNRWDTGLLTMDDLHQPGLDQIGFQESINEYRAWWTTNRIGAAWVKTSAGKQPAWINYMTDYNRTYGNFAIENNQMFMTLNRRFEPLDLGGGNPEGIKDLTTYIDPSKYNFIFAETAIDAQNFWVQIAVGRTVRRIMSAKIMPNL